MIIAVDIGNSFLKWKAFDSQRKIVKSGSCAADKLEMESIKLREISAHKLVYCCVANSVLAESLQTLVSEKLKCIEVKVSATAFGVKNGYEEPETLGVDRWVTAIEAHLQAQRGAVCVVDVGTAITLDVVDDQSCHMGGFIVPSEYLMRESLELSTSKVRASEAACGPGYGVTTSCAVHNGVAGLVHAWLEKEITLFKKQYPEGAIYLTGGGAAQMLRQINISEVIYSPDLLFEGLLRFAGNKNSS